MATRPPVGPGAVEPDRAPGRGMSGRPLIVLFAPDSFKGSLASVEVARALAAGWARARPEDRLELAPLADGGEGTLDAIHAAGGWAWRTAASHDPLGRPLEARWLRSVEGAERAARAAVTRDADGAGGHRAMGGSGKAGAAEGDAQGVDGTDRAEPDRAFVELAEASGLSRLLTDERDAGAATSRGTGEVIAAVLDAGVRHVVLGVGGSATTDGGSGILRALGARLLDADGLQIPPGGAALADLATIELDGLDPRLADTDLRVACDVTNPLLGERGAATTYGPQKGASPDDVRTLDAALARYADVLEAATGCLARDTAGAGAAGGTTFGLLCLAGRFRSVSLVPGVELVMDETGLPARLAGADIVVTGEGRIDAQTAFGKTALGVARRAAEAGVACIAVGGGVEPEGIAALAALGAIGVPVSEHPGSVEAAMAAGPAPLERAAERIARLITLGDVS